MENFVQADRNQPYLLPPDLREWLTEDDLAHFVVEAVERVPLSDFVVNTRGTGSAQYHPRVMPALLLAQELKLLTVGRVSVGGTKVKAAASKRRNIRYDRAVQLREQLRREVADLLG